MNKAAVLAAVTALSVGAVHAADVAPGDVMFEDGAIAASLTGAAGDPAAGRKVFDKKQGNCIACHAVTELEGELAFHGTVGPALNGVADSWSAAELRGIVANAKNMFPDTVMPSFYRVDGYVRPGNGYTGKAAEGPLDPLLTAQQIEDVVAFLQTLKGE